MSSDESFTSVADSVMPKTYFGIKAESRGCAFRRTQNCLKFYQMESALCSLAIDAVVEGLESSLLARLQFQ